MRSKTAGAALVLLLSGCALIKQGTTQTVTFKSKPAGAEIKVNGHTFLTPKALTLPKKECTVEFSLKGHQTRPYVLKTRTSSYFYWSLVFGILAGGVDWISGAWREFDIPDDGVVLVPLEVVLDKSEVLIPFSSDPPGAKIYIDGLEQQKTAGRLGTAPTLIVVKWETPKVKAITLRMENYATARFELKRTDKVFHGKLEPEPVPVTVEFESTPSGAEVLINGKRVTTTTTPLSYDLGWMPYAMEWKVEFRLPGYHAEHATITNRSQTKVSVVLDPKVRRIPVTIDCTPAGATLEVDDKVVGTAPATLELPWSINKSSYKIRLSRPGYESHEETIDDTRESAPVTVRLKPALPRLP